MKENKQIEKRKTKTLILAAGVGTAASAAYRDAGSKIRQKIEQAVKEYEAAGQLSDCEAGEVFLSPFKAEQPGSCNRYASDCLEQVLRQAASDGVHTLIVQPLHLTAGYEYGRLAAALEQYREMFGRMVMGKPLLSEEADYEAVVNAIVKNAEDANDGQTAVCLVGHGTKMGDGNVYERLQQKFIQAGYADYYVGTVSGTPSLEEVVCALHAKGSYKKVVLEPLMAVCGRHAVRDMAGDGENSWKRMLEKEGYRVSCIMEGLGQIPEIQDIYASHVQAAVKQLLLCYYSHPMS